MADIIKAVITLYIMTMKKHDRKTNLGSTIKIPTDSYRGIIPEFRNGFSLIKQHSNLLEINIRKKKLQEFEIIFRHYSIRILDGFIKMRKCYVKQAVHTWPSLISPLLGL